MVSKADTFLASQLSFLFLPWSRNLDWVIKVVVVTFRLFLLITDYFCWLLVTFGGLCHLWQKVLSPQVLYFSFKNPYILLVANISFISSWNICVCEYNLSTLLYSLITIIFPNVCREKKSTFFSKHVINEISHLKILEGYNLNQNRMTNSAVNLNLIVNLFLECSNVSKHTPLK